MSIRMVEAVFDTEARLFPAERLVLLALADCHNEVTGRCDPSTETLRRMTGLSARWAKATLAALEGRGLVSRIRVRKRGGYGWGYSFGAALFAQPPEGVNPVPKGGEATSPPPDSKGCTQFQDEVNSVPKRGELTSPEPEYNRNTTGRSSVRTTSVKFIPPSEDDVRSYCREKGYTNVDAADFVDYYESNGWKVGRVPMKDWRRTVNRWHRSGGTRRQDTRPAGQVLREREVGHDEHEYKL